MKTRIGQAKPLPSRDPCDDSKAADDAQQGMDVLDTLGHIAQKEQAEHTAREDGRKFPPCIEYRIDINKCQGHDDAKRTDNHRTNLEHDEMFTITYPIVMCMARAMNLAPQSSPIVGQNDGRTRSHRSSHCGHSCCKHRGNQQACQTSRQHVYHEIWEDVIGLICCIESIHLRVGHHLIVGIECRTDEEEDCTDRDEEPTTEEGGMLRFTFGLGRMIALHIVLVDAVVLQVDEDSIDQANPER